MSDEEKLKIRNQRRETYRVAVDDLRHREVQVKQWAEGFTAIAGALLSDSPDQMTFIGDTAWVGPHMHPILLEDIPTKGALKASTTALVLARQRVHELLADLRSLGE